MNTTLTMCAGCVNRVHLFISIEEDVNQAYLVHISPALKRGLIRKISENTYTGEPGPLSYYEPPCGLDIGQLDSRGHCELHR